MTSLAHVGAVLARQVKDRVDIRHHQPAGRFVGDLATGMVDQRRQAATLAPGGVGGHLRHLPVRFRLGDDPLDQMVEVDREALLVQTDGDVFEVDVNSDVLGLLNAEQRFQRLEDDLIGEFGAGQHVLRAPHTDAGVAGRANAAHQRDQVRVGGSQNQLVDRFGVEREVVNDQRVGQAGAHRHIESVEAGRLEHVLRVHVGRAGLALTIVRPVGDRDRTEAVRAEEASRERRAGPQADRQFLHVKRDAATMKVRE